MRFLPHLVEVNEKYRDKGVEIIMATDVDKAPDLEKFIAEKKLKLGVARVADVYKLSRRRVTRPVTASTSTATASGAAIPKG